MAMRPAALLAVLGLVLVVSPARAESYDESMFIETSKSPPAPESALAWLQRALRAEDARAKLPRRRAVRASWAPREVPGGVLRSMAQRRKPSCP